VQYFDHNATTPLDPRVRDAMLPWLGGLHGNPSSSHHFGREARRAVETARGQVAALLGAAAEEIVFTSSGTEANNAVVYGAAGVYGRRGDAPRHLAFSTLEHPSIVRAAARVADLGVEHTEIPPAADGAVTVEAVSEALRDDTRLACLMLANNELGTIQPVAEVAAVCRRRGVPLLCDAVQAIGKIPVDVGELGADYLTLGGHKFHAPTGIAALWIRDGAELPPLLVGGSQESGRRASTENLPAVVGLGVAAELAAAELEERHRKLRELRDAFEEGLGAIPGASVHCQGSARLPNTTHVAFAGVSGHQLMLALDRRGIAVSTGSACHSGRPQPSPVLLAMGVAESEALASLRISFGLTNTRDEVAALLRALASEVARPRPEDIEAKS
jgi:cysteine desulfurase